MFLMGERHPLQIYCHKGIENPLHCLKCVLYLLREMKQREKSRKYFELLTFNFNLYHSTLQSTLDCINFQKWELFSGPSSRNCIFSVNISKSLIPINLSVKTCVFPLQTLMLIQDFLSSTFLLYFVQANHFL